MELRVISALWLLCGSLTACPGAPGDSGDPGPDTGPEGDADTDADGDADSDTDADADCADPRFGPSASAWTFPADFPIDTFESFGGTSQVSWSLMDLQGDGVSDLVVSRWDAVSIDGLGSSKWLVFDNQGDGFAESASAWSFPAGFPADTFESFGGTSQVSWALMDLQGDGRSDLVVSRWDATSIDGLGTTKWLVYDNQGDGFAETARAWTFPAGFPTDTFESFGGTSQVGWALMDLQGDGLSDLVVSRWDAAAIEGLGTTKWLVFDNHGSGFAETASAWTFPSDFPTDTFEAFGGTSQVSWTLMDLEDQGAPDLFVSRWDGTAIDGLGTTKWLLFDNNGSGFAETASAWTMPADFPSSTFEAFGGSSTVSWSLLDLEGDGLSDLAVSRWDGTAIDGLGTTKWLLLDNNGSGFSDSGSAWFFPDEFPLETFEAFGASSHVSWSLLDLQGEGLSDLVVSRWDGTTIDGLGSTQWLVFANACGG